jgi:EAL domain-containing protein (putative c-di-GMP-specific phosphodiesterase class I)
MTPGLVNTIESILSDTGLEAGHLEIEITEEALMSEPDKTLQILSALRAAGIGVTVDDFGTGHSSLARLKQYPVGMVKIGCAFVGGIPQNYNDASITRAIIGLAHSLDCSVVAQGAETLQQYEFLRQHACDGVQGYYFSRPMPPAHFGELALTQFPH